MIQQDLPVKILVRDAPQEMQARCKELQVELQNIGKELRSQSPKLTSQDREDLALKSLQVRNEAKASSSSHENVGNAGLLLATPQHFSPQSAQYSSTVLSHSISPLDLYDLGTDILSENMNFDEALRKGDFQMADNILQSLENVERWFLLNTKLNEGWDIVKVPLETAIKERNVLLSSYLLDRGADPQTPAASSPIIYSLIDSFYKDESINNNVQPSLLYTILDKLISSENFNPHTTKDGETPLGHLLRWCHCDQVRASAGYHAWCSFKRGGWTEHIITRLLDTGAELGPGVGWPPQGLVDDIGIGICPIFRAIYEDWYSARLVSYLQKSEFISTI